MVQNLRITKMSVCYLPKKSSLCWIWYWPPKYWITVATLQTDGEYKITILLIYLFQTIESETISNYMHRAGLHQIQIPTYPLKPSDASRRHQTNLKYVLSQFYNSPDNCYPSHGLCLKRLSKRHNRIATNGNEWQMTSVSLGAATSSVQWLWTQTTITMSDFSLTLGSSGATDNNGKWIQPHLGDRYNDNEWQWQANSTLLEVTMGSIQWLWTQTIMTGEWLWPHSRQQWIQSTASKFSLTWAVRVRQTTTELALWLAKSNLFVFFNRKENWSNVGWADWILNF